jgi:tyrosine decarboxylase / aspartate 1-decarboxylase
MVKINYIQSKSFSERIHVIYTMMLHQIQKDREKEILEELKDYQKKDLSFSSGRILGSMCGKPHPIAHKAYNLFLETNLGDPNIFKGTREIEKRFIFFIQNLLNAPPTAAGLIVSGGTEGNITAMWVAKQLSQNNEIIIPASAHFSFQKIATMMDMKLKPIPLSKKYQIDVSQIKKRISSSTAAVVGIAGSTDLGTIDPIEELSDICADEHIFLHIDAAFGGFIIPFLKEAGYEIPAFDFSLEGVSSISIDTHKMGYSAIPLGTIILKEKEWIEEISVRSPCISSDTQAGILGTRSGGPVAAGYAVSRYLGMEGYAEIVKHCMSTTKYTVKNLKKIGLTLVREPVLNVIVVRLKNPGKIVTLLEKEGWKVNKIDHLSSIRIVCMPTITKEIIDEFIDVLQMVCKKAGEL